MTILAIAIVMLCLGSVSAVEDKDLNSTLETVNDISQDEKIVINEINQNPTDEVIQGGDYVSVDKKQDLNKNILKASDGDVLKSSSEFELRDKDTQSVGTSSNPIEVAAGKTITVQYSAVVSSYDSLYLKMSENNNAVDNYGSTVQSSFSSSEEWADVYSFTTTDDDVGNTYAFKLYAYYSNNVAYLYYKIIKGTEDTQISLNVEKDTADNTKVTITPTVTSGETIITTADSVEIYVNGEKLASNIAADGSVVYTNSEENTYSVYAHYVGDNAYSASNSTVSLFSLGTSKPPVNLTVSLDVAGIAPEGSIVVTPIIKDENGNSITGTVDIFEEGIDGAVLSDVSGSGATYTPDSSHSAGNSYQLYAVFNDANYAHTTSSKVSYKIKQKFDIVLTVDGETDFKAIGGSYSSSATHYIFYADCGGLAPALKVYDVYDGETTLVYDGDVHGDSQEIDMWFSYSNERGSHVVYVEFEEDDNYLYSKSNDVTFNVYYPVEVRVSMSPNYGIEGETVTITPKVTYNSNNVEGTLKLYSDSSKNTLLDTVEIGNNPSFEFTVPENTGSSAYQSKSIYYTFEGYDDENYYVYTESYYGNYFTFYSMNENSLTISADGESSSIQIDKGASITLSVDNLDYKYQYDETKVAIYIEGESEPVAYFPTSGTYKTTLGEYELTFDTTNYPNREYVIYAVYEGYVNPSYNYYYAPCESNHITVKIGPQPVDTTVTLSDADASYPQGETVTITATVNDGTSDLDSTNDGTVTYYDNGNPIDGFTNVAVGTTLSISSLGVGEHNISASYSGGELHNPSQTTTNVSFVITAVAGFTINVNNETYGTSLHATGSVEEAGEYTFTVKDTDISITQNLEAGSYDVNLGILDANETYVAVIAHGGQTKEAVFNVSKKNPSKIEVELEDTTFLVDSPATISATVWDGESEITSGSITFIIETVESEPVDMGAPYTLDTSSVKTYDIVAKFSGNDNYNEISSEPNTITVLAEIPTTISVSVISSSVKLGDLVRFTVDATNRNGEIKKGNVKVYYTETDFVNIDLADKNYVDFDTSSLTKGQTYTVRAEYEGYDAEKLASAQTTENPQFKVKDSFNIQITVDGETEEVDVLAQSILGSTYITIVADCGDLTPELVVYVDGQATSTKIAEGSSQTSSVGFTQSQKGQHVVYVKFEGDDDYDEAVSNEVKVNVYKPQSVSASISFDKTVVDEGDNVLVTINVGTAPLNVTLYSDSSCSNKIEHIEGSENTYDLAVGETEGDDGSRTYYLYGTYDGAYDEDNFIYYYASGYSSYDFSGSFTAVRENSITLKINDGNEPITVDYDGQITLHVDLTYYHSIVGGYSWSPSYSSNITIMMDDTEEIATIAASGASAVDDYVLTLNDDKYLGTHSFKAVFGGSSYTDDYYNKHYYGAATSESIDVTVLKEVELSISTQDTSVYEGNTITIVQTISVVSEGSITYRDEKGNVLAENVPTTQENVVLTLDVGSYTITATYNNVTGYKQTTSNSIDVVVKPEAGFRISVDEVSYGANSTATISVSQAGTYTISIDGISGFKTVTFDDENEFVKTVDLGKLNAHDLYHAVISYDGLTNETYFNVSQSEVEIALNEYDTEPLAGDSNPIVASVEGYNITGTFDFVEGETTLASDVAIGGEFDAGLLNAGQHTITVRYSGDDNYKSNTKDITINVLDELPTTIELTAPQTPVAKGESARLTVAVSNKKGTVTKGEVAFYYDGETTPIATIDLADGVYYIDVDTNDLDKGETYTVKAVYLGDSESKFAQETSENKQFALKKAFTIAIDVDGEENELDLSTSSRYTYVTVTADCGDVKPELVIYDGETTYQISEGSTYNSNVRFYNADKGQHTIYAKFEGNATHEAAESNHVTVNVYDTISSYNIDASITTDVDKYAMEKDTVVITPAVLYNNLELPGEIVIYQSDKQSVINTTSSSESSEFEIPETEGLQSKYSYIIYAKYNGYKDSENFIEYASKEFQTSFIVARNNEINLTANGENETLEVEFANQITFHIDYRYWLGTSEGSNITLYMDDGQAIAVIPTYYEASVYELRDYVLSLDDDKYVGEHTFYAVYGGYYREYAFGEPSIYTPATSNSITVTTAKNTTISLQSDDTDIYVGNPVTISHTVKDIEGKDVTVGSVTYSENGLVLAENVAINDDAVLNALDVGEHIITATYNGVNGYGNNFTTIEINVKPAAGFTVRVNNVTYGINSTATVTAQQAGTYKITIDGITQKYELTFAQDEHVKTVDLGKLNAHDLYHAVIEFDGFTNETYFNVSKNQVEITLNEYDTEPLAGDSNPIVASVEGYNITGTFDFVEGETTLASDVAIGGEFDAGILNAGQHTITVRYSGDDNYNETSKEITLNVLAELPTAIEVSVNETNIKQGQPIRFTVNVTNKNGEIKKGIVKVYYTDVDYVIIDLSDKNYTEFDTKELSKGETYTVKAEYEGYPDDKLASALTTEDKSFYIKDSLELTLTRTDSGILKPGDTATFTISLSDSSIASSVELWINGAKLWTEDGSATTSIEFETSDVGKNNVSLYFPGNDKYEPARSENVTVIVQEPIATSVTLELNSTEVTKDGKINVIAHVWANGEEIFVGNVRIYETAYYSYQDPLATVNAGGDYNHTHKTNNFLYGIFMGYDDENVHYAQSAISQGYQYEIVEANGLKLTVNESESEFTIYAGQSVDILVQLENGNGEIVLYINDENNGTVENNKVKTIRFDNADDYVIVANYTRGSDKYQSAASNEVILHVIEKKSSEVKLISNSPVTYSQDIKILADVTSEGVKISDGKVKYYVNGIENETLSIGETLKFKASSINPYVIGAEYIGTEEFAASSADEITVTVNKAENNVVVRVDDVTLPGFANIYVKADIPGEYKVKLNDTAETSLTVKVLEPNKEFNTTVDAEILKGKYCANVTAPDYENYTVLATNDTFEVKKADVSLRLIIEENIAADTNITGYIITNATGEVTVQINDLEPFNVQITGDTTEFTTIKLPVGENYHAVVTISDSNYFNDKTSGVEFNVISNPVNFIANSTKKEYVYGDEVILNYTLPQGATGEIVFTYESGSEGEAGKIIVPADNQLSLGKSLKVGEYVIKAVFTDSTGIYETSTKYVNFKVSPKENAVKVSVEEMTYGENINVSISDAIDGVYKVTINGNDIIVNVVGNEGSNTTAKISLAVGNDYEVSVSLDNDNYTTTGSATFNVIPADNDVDVAIENVEYGQQLTVTINNAVEGTYNVEINGNTIIVEVDETGYGSQTKLVDLPVGNDYEASVSLDNGNYTTTGSATFNVTKATNNVKIEVSDVTLPEKATVNVTADIAGTYIVKFDDTHNISVVVENNGDKVSCEVALDEGTYTPSLSDYDDDNYEANVVANQFTVSAKPTVEVVIKLRDANYTQNSTITINSNENVSIVLEYFLQRPDEIMFVPEIDGYVNGEHLSGFGVYREELLVNGVYTTLGALRNISQSCELDVYVIFKTTAMFSEGYNVESNHIKYIINIEKETVPSLTVEVDPVKDSENATIVVKSNVPGEYVIKVNEADYSIVIGEDGVNSTVISVLPANTYTVTVTSKDNASFTNNTELVVEDTSVPEPASLTVEADPVKDSENATIVVKSNVPGEYVVSVNEADYSIVIGEDGVNSTVIAVLPANTYTITVKAKNNASFMNTTDLVVTETPVVSVNISLRERQHMGDDGEFTITFTDSYSMQLAYKLDKENLVVKSESVTLYYNGAPVSLAIPIVVGEYSTFATSTIDSEGIIDLKVVYNATLDDGSEFIAESNLLNITFVKETTPTEVSIAIRDATYTENSTITINSKENVSIVLEYLLQRPDEIMFAPEINGYVNGEHLSGFGIYREELLVNGVYTTLGALSNISESCELDVYVIFKTTGMFSEGYNVESNHIKYIINIEKETVASLTVEVDPVKDSENATIVVKSNVPGEYIINVNNANYSIVIGEDGVNSTVIAVLPANTYTVTVTSKDNASFTNNTGLVVEDSSVPEPASLTVEANKATYPNNATITVKTNKPGDYIVNVAGKDYNVTVTDGKTTLTLDVLDVKEYDVVVTSKDNASFTNKTSLTITKGLNVIVVDVEDVILPENVTVVVNATVDGQYTVKINGRTLTVNVTNGTGSNTIGLPEGNYIANVDYQNDNYDVLITTDSFTVNPEMIEGKLSIRDANAPLNSTITVTGEGNVTITVEYYILKHVKDATIERIQFRVNGNITVVDEVINGTYTKVEFVVNETSDLTINASYYAWKFMDNEYGLTSENLIYHITIKEAEKENATLSIKVSEVNYPENATVEITASEDGQYIVVVGEKTYAVNVTNGTGSVVLDVLEAGDYNLSVVSKANESIRNETKFTISPETINGELSISIDDVTYPDNATAIVKSNIDGDYVVNVNSRDYDVTVKNGTGSVVLDTINVGSYSASVVSKVDADLRNTTSFEVIAPKTNVTLQIRDSKYPSNATVAINGEYELVIEYNIALPSGYLLSNDLIVYVNDEAVSTISEPVNNAYTAITPIRLNETGEYAIKLRYQGWVFGGDQYNVTSNIISYSINIANETEDNQTLSVEVSKTSYPENATLSITAGKDGLYTVSVANKTYVVNVTNGTGSVVLDKLPAGEYDLTVTSQANETVKNQTTLKVEKASGYEIKADSKDGIITVEVPEDATGNVTVSIGNKTYELPIVDGKAFVNVTDNLPGDYDAEIVYSGDDNYNLSSKAINVSIPQKQKDKSKISVIYVNGNGTIKALLFDSEGKGIANANVTYRVNGVENATATDENGEITLHVTFNCVVDMIFEGNDELLPANTTISLKNIVPPKVETQVLGENFTQYAIEYYNGERGGNFTVQLRDVNGNILANKTVLIGYNGKTLTRTTDANGYATVQINLKDANRLTFAVSFLGDDEYEASMSVYLITIVKKPVTITANAKAFKASAKTKKYTITLKTIKGASCDGKTYFGAGKKVTMKINGKTYTAKTNAKGQATFKLSITKKGKYAATIKYAGDTTYLSASKTVKYITIK